MIELIIGILVAGYITAVSGYVACKVTLKYKEIKEVRTTEGILFYVVCLPKALYNKYKKYKEGKKNG